MSSEPIRADVETAQEAVESNVKSQTKTEPMDDLSNTPPSSPPVAREDSSEEMPSPSRKRSHDDMNIDSVDENDSSVTAVGEPHKAEIQNTTPAATKPSTSAHAMPPPPAPVSSMPPPPRKPPRSGQGTANILHAQSASPQAKIAPDDSFENPCQNTGSAEALIDHAEEPNSPLYDPQDKIHDFDWNDLQQRYHDKIARLNATEQGIVTEFNDLCDYFGIWAGTGSAHEVDRSFKRLKTQITFVQHHEDELEQRRQHYIKVVDAFKNALDLLIR